MTESLHLPDLCWIASYPRSGNTFLRIVISNILFGNTQHVAVDADIPEYAHPKPLDITNARHALGSSGDVVFAKTHYLLPPLVQGVRAASGIYVFRHPLDVFLSGLNYVYINAEANPSFKSYFIDGVPKSVENAQEDGQLGLYFERFLQDDGILPFRSFSGGWCENLVSWHRAASNSDGKLVCVNYVDLIAKTEEIVSRVFENAA